MDSATTRRPVVPAWPAVVVLAALSGLAVGLGRDIDERDCSGLGECLGNGITMLALTYVVAPLVVLVGMLLLRFRRRDLLTPLLVAIAATLVWEALEFLAGETAGERSGWWWWALVHACLVVAAWLLVRHQRTPWALRLVPLGVLLALLAGTIVVAGQVRHDRRVQDVEAVPVTLYLVDLGREFQVDGVYAADQRYVSVGYSGRVDGNYSLPDVTLVPASAGATACEAVAANTSVLGFNPDACSGDPFLTTDPGHTAVGLTRGDTVLVASFSTDSGLDASWVREQLLAAPEVGAEQLVP